jgi:hypothetical protein
MKSNDLGRNVLMVGRGNDSDPTKHSVDQAHFPRIGDARKDLMFQVNSRNCYFHAFPPSDIDQFLMEPSPYEWQGLAQHVISLFSVRASFTSVFLALITVANADIA